jgi:RimJ/RimL family protein N-acetyltransferase
VRPVLPTLIETDEADFEWMTGGASTSKRGLTLPPGGVDSNEVLVHVRTIARSLAEQQGHTDNWMIVADREVVGLCGYKHRPSVDGAVDIGYSISASRRRRAHATSAVAAIIASAQADPRISYIIAETAIDNHPSQRVLIKNGFQCIGIGIDSEDGEHLLRWRVSVTETPKRG